MTTKEDDLESSALFGTAKTILLLLGILVRRIHGWMVMARRQLLLVRRMASYGSDEILCTGRYGRISNNVCWLLIHWSECPL